MWGTSARAMRHDVSSEADSYRAVKDAEEAFGHVNVLVNNAGALSVSTVESISVEEWDRLMATNLKGPFLMSRAVLPAMRQAGGGAIVNGDANGAAHYPDDTPYRKKFGGKYVNRIIKGGIGHNLPQEAPQAFVEAIVDVAEI
jgi:NAD(P)-dependent dehydrogenase (short-subunit alcohol dehydrogenase family)